MTSFQYWLMSQLAELSAVFGPDYVLFNENYWGQIQILFYPLPANWWPQFSQLMIVFPAETQAWITPPDRFYLQKGLRTTSGRTPTHYYEDGGPASFNDLSDFNWARYSFHVKGSWSPRLNDDSGSNLVELLDSLDDALYAAAQEADNA